MSDVYTYSCENHHTYTNKNHSMKGYVLVGADPITSGVTLTLEIQIEAWIECSVTQRWQECGVCATHLSRRFECFLSFPLDRV